LNGTRMLRPVFRRELFEFREKVDVLRAQMRGVHQSGAGVVAVQLEREHRASNYTFERLVFHEIADRQVSSGSNEGCEHDDGQQGNTSVHVHGSVSSGYGTEL